MTPHRQIHEQDDLRQRHVEDLLQAVRNALEVPSEDEWRIVHHRAKINKIIFEIATQGIEYPSQMIAKVTRTERGRAGWVALNSLWEAGFCPPSDMTVVRPVAYLPEQRLLLQEKAPGTQLIDAVTSRSEHAVAWACKAARWISCLHAAPLSPDEGRPYADRMERCSGELASEVPSQASRIARLGDEISGALRAFTSLDLVPCHGDYHPMNVFIDDDGRVTVIDLDTLSSCERESDIAYFCAQTAIMGYFEFGSFGDTLPVREAFLSGYGLPLDSRRLGVYAAEAFLRSLHYDLCILRTNQRTLIDPWLTAAAQCLSGDIRLQ